MPHTVVVGVDADAASPAAVHWAAREAARHGGGLAVVHAARGPARPREDVAPAGAGQDRSERTVREALHVVRADHPGLPVTGRVASDSPVAALLTAAAEAGVLVLGSHGVSGVTGFVTGSVSHRVVARSPRPVVLVRPGWTAADEHLPAADGVAPEEIPATPHRAVVLGLDVRHPCDELIGFAFDAARRRGTCLTVVHAFKVPHRPASDASLVTTPAAPPPPVAGAEALAAAERAVSAALGPWCEKYPAVRVTRTVTEGRAATALVRAAHDAGLLVVGRRTGGGRLGAHTGPVTHAVLHHAACPVAVVPHV
ncbi:universal stress family protein [Streptomyces toyocaensis]|uniref:Universal stress family protein n=2 Tax=Streptomyces toyocaensis TaxID=55952 RepID=A0A081XI13_STRTO|nr:universal stress protein [Streptomyces toyocaensis]KES03186.1 universal stress family protein [Streptomyces toyocaensis]